MFNTACAVCCVPRAEPSLKDYYYGKKTDDYAAAGAAYGNPGYNSQYPNPPNQGYAAQQQQQPPQAMGPGPAFYGQQQQQPQMPYPPQYGHNNYPQQPQQPYPQQPYPQPYPDQGYYPQPGPAPGPYYPPKPAPGPYYPPKPHQYYPKPRKLLTGCL